MKPYKFGSARGRRWPKIVLFFAIAAAILFAGAALGVRTIYLNNLEPRDASAQEDITFVIETGATLEVISKSLEEKGIIKASWAFSQYVRSKELGESFKAGTYRLKASMPAEEVAAALTEGRVAMDLFTILPGKRIDQVRQRFIDAGFTAAEVDAALDPTLYTDHPALVDKPEGASLEGYLYPDSYQRITQTTPQTIITQALDEMAEALNPEIRQGIAAQGLSVYEGIIMASIVEQEIPAPPASAADDRRQAAQVFLKRYGMGMQLGSDVTAVYGGIIDKISLPEDTVRAIATSIAHDSPYNTRINSGLPPGPIGNVTLGGLQAVASPSTTDYLYFVAGDGEYRNQTFFSRTLDEHNAAVAKYCTELCR